MVFCCRRVAKGSVNAGGTNPFPASSGPTSITFSSIPTYATQIQLGFYNVGFNSGATTILIQIGTASGISTTGYVATSLVASTGNAGTVGSTSTSGFVMEYPGGSGPVGGLVTITNVTAGSYCCSGTLQNAANRMTCPIGQSPALGSALTQVKVTTTGGAAFNAGSIQIYYI